MLNNIKVITARLKSRHIKNNIDQNIDSLPELRLYDDAKAEVLNRINTELNGNFDCSSSWSSFLPYDRRLAIFVSYFFCKS